MLADIHPKPSEDERAAILVALERLLAEEQSQRARSEWWAAGLREGLDEEDEL